MMTTINGVDVTTQQNNVLINLMLNGELGKVLYGDDQIVAASIYRNGWKIVLLATDGHENYVEDMR